MARGRACRVRSGASSSREPDGQGLFEAEREPGPVQGAARCGAQGRCAGGLRTRGDGAQRCRACSCATSIHSRGRDARKWAAPKAQSWPSFTLLVSSAGWPASRRQRVFGSCHTAGSALGRSTHAAGLVRGSVQQAHRHGADRRRASDAQGHRLSPVAENCSIAAEGSTRVEDLRVWQ